MNTINNDERREFFRIEDDIYLDINIITEDEYKAAPEILENLHNDEFSLSADFATLNNNSNPILNNIKQTYPDIAQYLEFLNTKIDSLSDHLLQRSSAYDETKKIRANISASGIMFESNQSFTNGDYVKMEIVLFPEKIGILIFGKTVKVTKREDNNNYISIEFGHIRNEDQELMIKHNLNKQMLELREKNNLI